MHDELKKPLILAFVADILFATRIESAAERAGFRVAWVENAVQVSDEQDMGPERQPAEHLIGAGSHLIDLVTRLRPALIVMDLGNGGIPWREWIALLKSAPATRRYPLLAYGAHVDAESLAEAKRRGADAALARSRMADALPELITKYARVLDTAALALACDEALTRKALEGLELFNKGEYFEAHEALETAWKADDGPGRELYRAVLQVAVAYLQIERRNYNGAVKMFLRLRQWIEPLPDVCRGVDVARLRKDAEQARLTLIELGPERIGEFDRRLFRPVIYDQASST